MESLYLLIPLSAGLVLAILAVFGWAVHAGQFDELQDEGQRILEPDSPGLDVDQGAATTAPKESTH